MSKAPFEPLSGGCKCGAVRFTLASEPLLTHCCHCRDCQKLSGSAFRINLMIERDRLLITRGEAVTVEAHDGPEARCPHCAWPLWGYHRRFGTAIAFIGVGLLDEGERLAPEVHFFTRSRHPWITLPPEVPAFETLGDPGKRHFRERLDAALRVAGLGSGASP